MSGNKKHVEHMSEYIKSLDLSFDKDGKILDDLVSMWKDLQEVDDENVVIFYFILKGSNWLKNEEISKQLTAKPLFPLIVEEMDKRGI